MEIASLSPLSLPRFTSFSRISSSFATRAKQFYVIYRVTRPRSLPLPKVQSSPARRLKADLQRALDMIARGSFNLQTALGGC